VQPTVTGPEPRGETSWWSARRKAAVGSFITAGLAGGALLYFGITKGNDESSALTAKAANNYDLAGKYKSDAQSHALAANLSLGIGAAAAITGVVLILWPQSSKGERSVTIVPTGMGAALAVRY
jgi:hypothetical protein